MIQILKIISNIKKYITVSNVAMVMLMLSLLGNSVLKCQNDKLNKEVETKTNNIEAYEGMLNDANSANNVLRLDISTLSSSRDILLNKLDSVRNKLKISDRALRTAMVQHSSISVSEKDTVHVTDSCEFKKEFRPNELTILKIELKGDSISYDLKISNDQYLMISSKKDWKNKNKKFFKRLFTWDWKKITYYKYDIVNTNPLIQIGKTRVIENTENK